jgi:hypothetical protein
VSEFGKVTVTSTPAENGFFRANGKLKLEILLHHHTGSEFRHTSKNFEGWWGYQKVVYSNTKACQRLLGPNAVTAQARLTNNAT